MPDRYAAYPSLELERPANGVLRVVMRAPGRPGVRGRTGGRPAGRRADRRPLGLHHRRATPDSGRKASMGMDDLKCQLHMRGLRSNAWWADGSPASRWTCC
jgi:hypothetical protein